MVKKCPPGILCIENYTLFENKYPMPETKITIALTFKIFDAMPPRICAFGVVICTISGL